MRQHGISDKIENGLRIKMMKKKKKECASNQQFYDHVYAFILLNVEKCFKIL